MFVSGTLMRFCFKTKSKESFVWEVMENGSAGNVDHERHSHFSVLEAGLVHRPLAGMALIWKQVLLAGSSLFFLPCFATVCP